MVTDSQTIQQGKTDTHDAPARLFINVLLRWWKMIAAFTFGAMLVYGAYGWFSRDKEVPTWRAVAELAIRQTNWDKWYGTTGKPLIDNTPQALIKRVGEQDLVEDVTSGILQSCLAVPLGACVTG